MKRIFDPADYVRRTGVELVRAFDNARQATTPELVGDAMEQPVRKMLEQILPLGIGIGSGCVIDKEGGTSRQMDVVLYEKELCPVFRINDSDETTYYPCEGVLAVGEVKSAIGKKDLEDCFRKISSVKVLHRAYEYYENEFYVGRRYGESGSTTAQGFCRDQTDKGDIFGFILAENASIAITLPDPSKTHRSAPKATLLGHYVENVNSMRNDVLCPDLTVFLDGNLLSPLTIDSDAVDSNRPYTPTRTKPILPHLIHPWRSESPFGELLKMIWKRHQGGLTAHIPLEHYLHYNAKTESNLTWAAFANVKTMNFKVGDPVRIQTPTGHLKDTIVTLAKNSV